MAEMNTAEYEAGLAQLDNGVAKLKNILEGKDETSFTPMEYMYLYTATYNICTCKQSPNESRRDVLIYERYKEIINKYLGESVLPSLREKHGGYMLTELNWRWSNHKLMIRWLDRFFAYLDRYFVTRRDLPRLRETGMCCFRTLVYGEIKWKARDAVIGLIEEEREGGQIDRAMVKNVVDIFIAMGIKSLDYYDNDFEKDLLEATTTYYARKATIWIAENSCPDYMIMAEESLKQEKDRVSHYLHNNTEEKLLEKVQEQLLAVPSAEILGKEHSGCLALLRNDKVDDLSRMYRLFLKVPNGLDPVAAMFRDHVAAGGQSIVKQAEHAASIRKPEKKEAGSSGSYEHVFIRNLIQLHDKYMGYVMGCFQNHSLFHRSLKDAFESFCNKSIDGSSTAELLATFCDDILKSGSGGAREKVDEAEIEGLLEKVVQLLLYVSDKDLFAEFCRKKLARRLLFNMSGSEDHEKSLVMKLKQQWGSQFTSKMEGMVTDFTLARDSQASFEEYRSNNPKPTHKTTDLTVSVLTTGFWPTYKTADLNPPEEMARCMKEFMEYYKNTTKNRRLTWNYSLGSCHILGRFDAKQIELVVNPYQAAVILLFNSSDRLSYDEIKTGLNLLDEDLVRVMQSLSCAKYKILNKEPNTRNVSTTDVFEYNSKFTDKMRRIRINLPPSDEKKKIIEDVGKDRKHTIDAALVRIMKTRKTLGYQALVTECLEQLSKMFKPDPKMIKKRIEDLITRDYIVRDNENANVFNYVA